MQLLTEHLHLMQIYFISVNSNIVWHKKLPKKTNIILTAFHYGFDV